MTSKASDPFKILAVHCHESASLCPSDQELFCINSSWSEGQNRDIICDWIILGLRILGLLSPWILKKHIMNVYWAQCNMTLESPCKVWSPRTVGDWPQTFSFVTSTPLWPAAHHCRRGSFLTLIFGHIFLFRYLFHFAELKTKWRFWRETLQKAQRTQGLIT